MSDTSYRAELEIGNDQVVIAKAKIAELESQLASLKTAEAQRVAQVELESMALEHLIEMERWEQAELDKTAAARDAEVAAIGRQIAAQLKASERTERSDLAEQAEREAMAIEHEIAMLEHEQRQLAATTAAQDHEIDSLERSITERARAESASEQEAAALARNASARSGLKAAEDAELASLERSIAAQNQAEAEALELSAAMLREQNAIFAADGALENFTADCSAAASAQGRLAVAAGTARGGMSTLTQSITAGSYAFQDFTATSGDLGAKMNSITNNLPTLLAGMGHLGIVLSVAATAGVAVYRNWDSISSLWETRSPFVKGAEDVAQMKNELDKAKEATEKFEKAGVGNAKQIEEYNRLRARTAELEKQIADQKERQQRLDKFLGSKTEEDEGRGKGYEEATKGKGQETLDKIARAMQRDAEYEINAAAAQMNRNVDAFNAQKHTDEEKEQYLREESARFLDLRKMLRNQDWSQLAKDLNDRLLKGEKTAGEILDRLMDGTGVVFNDLRKRMDEANPVLKKAAEEWEKTVEAANKIFDAMEKEAGKTDKEKLDAHLDEMKARGGIGKVGDQLADEAKAKGLEGNAAFDHIEKGLTQAIKDGLEFRGFKAPAGIDIGQDKAVGDVAVAATKKAIADQARGDKRDATKEGKNDDKVQREASKAGAHQAELDFKFHAQQEEAEAKRIVDQFGKHAVEAFEQQIKASMLPAETAAKNLVNVMTQQITATGVRMSVANRVAREVAEKAGFKVAAPRELAGPPIPDAATARRVAIAKKKLAPEQAKERKRILAEQAAARKKALADARKAKANRNRPKPAAPKPAAQPAPQAALDKTLDVVGKTQDAVAIGQRIDAQLAARLAVLERRTTTLESTNRGLLTRAQEQAPTASNSGANVA